MSKQLLFKDKLLYWIVILLGFQQFPIIRAGGSLKSYEILGFILVGYNILHYKAKFRITKIELYSAAFFIFVPVFSYIYSSVFFDYPVNYYNFFPKAKLDFKANYYLFPLLQIFYMVMNWNVFVGLVNSAAIYENIQKLMRVAIIFGTIIAIYSLFALYVFDFIPLLPDFIQFKFTKEGSRSTGLSQEPGTYVLYQMWICLFIWYSKKSFTKRWWYIVFIINVVSCVLTQSTPLWGFVFAIVMSLFMFNTSVTKRRNGVIGMSFLAIVTFLIVRFSGYSDTFYNTYVKKVNSFVSNTGHRASNSGEIRKYMSDIGYAIYENYPFVGVGYGRSMYYMYSLKKTVGISYSSEKVEFKTIPLSMFSVMASEMGTLGLLSFCVFYLYIFSIFWKKRNKSPLHKMFLIGYIAEFGTLFSLYTPHAVFLWAYLGLGFGYIKYFDKKEKVLILYPA